MQYSNPIHLSWTNKQDRYDFIFNPIEPINNIVKLESDATNFLTKSLGHCANKSACLLQNGQYLESYEVDNKIPNKSKFNSIKRSDGTTKSFNSTDLLFDCEGETEFTINHYCSTHWNPPAYIFKSACNHLIEWHSPLYCHKNSTNYERPCYIYDSLGKLIDLTPWILSNGSSYEVDVTNSSVKKFSLNVCNEAHDTCGPNVSSCLVDENNGLIESGFNNLTSIRYDTKDKSVHLTSLGQFNQQCEGSRVKTVVHFICENKIITKTKPKLIRSSACEQIIEWQTIHACPVTEIKVPATNCKIKYPELGIDIDVKKLLKNVTQIEADFSIAGGIKKRMIFGVCQGLPRSGCGGKMSSSTSACLVDGISSGPSTPLQANNSEIVGSITKSFIRFADDRLYLETSAHNKTCSTKSRSLNVTKQLGTRIELYCSAEAQEKPKYLGFEDCTYIFEWASPELCHESLAPISSPKRMKSPSLSVVTPKPPKVQPQETTNKSITTSAPTQTKPSRKNPVVVEVDTKAKSAREKHVDTLNSAAKITQQAIKGMPAIARQEATSSVVVAPTKAPIAGVDKVEIQPVPAKNLQPRMDSTHKFFMISMILMSLVGFVVVIFILDKKTRLRVPISAIRRRAGQAFQAQPVPYSRVDNFNDSLDL